MNEDASLIVVTSDTLDGPLAADALAMYHEAFPAEGRKPDAIIRKMFDRNLANLHVGLLDGEPTAMAITGGIPTARLLLIDYLAVREKRRSQGLGGRFVAALADWARDAQGLDGMLLESEADPGEMNARRIAFWQRCGFRLTDYVHRYVWVPETYRAMYSPFHERLSVPEDGESLFRLITDYHRKAFAR